MYTTPLAFTKKWYIFYPQLGFLEKVHLEISEKFKKFFIFFKTFISHPHLILYIELYFLNCRSKANVKLIVLSRIQTTNKTTKFPKMLLLYYTEHSPNTKQCGASGDSLLDEHLYVSCGQSAALIYLWSHQGAAYARFWYVPLLILTNN